MSSNFAENVIFKSLSIIILIAVILIITYAYTENTHIIYTKGVGTDRDLYRVQAQTLYFIISLISCIVFIDFRRRKKKLKQ